MWTRILKKEEEKKKKAVAQLKYCITGIFKDQIKVDLTDQQ